MSSFSKLPQVFESKQIPENEPNLKLLFHIVVSFIPTLAIALIFKFGLKEIFGNLTVVCVAWMIMAAYLLAGKWFYAKSLKEVPMTWQIAFLIGVAQGLAVTPGISRSGFTILTALFLGVARKESVRFSFLMSVPVILAAMIFELKDLGAQSDFFMPVIVGFIVSFVVGYLIIGVLIRLVEKGGFFNFGFYCLALSLLSFFLLL